jgi:hypothetical protein
LSCRGFLVPAEANTAMAKLRRLTLICDIRLPPATDEYLLSTAYIEAAPCDGSSFILDVTAVHLEASGRPSRVECCYYRPGRPWDLCFCTILLRSGPREAVQGQNIPLSSLLSINIISEAFHKMTLLRSKMFTCAIGRSLPSSLSCYVSRLRRTSRPYCTLLH